MPSALSPLPTSSIGGKVLASQHQPALSSLSEAPRSSATCLKPWPPISGCAGNRAPSLPKEVSGLQQGECSGHW